MAKDAKIGKFAIGEACPGEKAKGVAGAFSSARASERTKGRCSRSHTEGSL